MRRREFFIGASAIALSPLAARAQSTPVVGVLYAGGDVPTLYVMEALRKGLGEAGAVEGRDFRFEIRATARYEQLPALAGELARAGTAVIVSIGTTNAAVAAKTVAPNIPIVFALGGDPVALGLVASYNRPGGNVTGVTFFADTLNGKRLEFLREIAPRAGKIAWLGNSGNLRADTDWRSMQEAARSIGESLARFDARDVAEIETAFVAATEQGFGALMIGGDPFFANFSAPIAAIATRQKMPATFTSREGPLAGGLMSYGDDRRDSFRQAGLYVGRILKGEKPANLPVMQPSKFEFVINLKTAKALGLNVPQTLLVFADEVIE